MFKQEIATAVTMDAAPRRVWSDVTVNRPWNGTLDRRPKGTPLEPGGS